MARPLHWSSAAPKITSLSTANAAHKGSSFDKGSQTKCGLRGKPCLCEGNPGCHAGARAEALLVVHQGYPSAGGAGYKLDMGVSWVKWHHFRKSQSSFVKASRPLCSVCLVCAPWILVKILEKKKQWRKCNMSSMGVIPLGPSWRLLVGLQGENFSLSSQRDARTHLAIQISRTFILTLKTSIYFEEVKTTTSLSSGTSCPHQGQEVQAVWSCRQVGSCSVPQPWCITEHLRNSPTYTCKRETLKIAPQTSKQTFCDFLQEKYKKGQFIIDIYLFYYTVIFCFVRKKCKLFIWNSGWLCGSI